MMASTLLLETFSTGEVDTPLSQTPAQLTVTYEEGFAAGIAAAEEGFAAQQAGLKRELVKALTDSLAQVEAIRAEVLAAVAPLHDALVAVLLPEIMAPALNAQLRKLVAEAASADLASPLSIAVPSGQAEVLSEVLADTDVAGITFVEDSTLSSNAVRVATSRHETTLDLDSALAAIAAEMAALQAFIMTSHEVSTYG